MRGFVKEYYIEPEKISVSSAQSEAEERMADDDLEERVFLMSFWLSVWFLICSISVNLASRLKEWFLFTEVFAHTEGGLYVVDIFPMVVKSDVEGGF